VLFAYTVPFKAYWFAAELLVELLGTEVGLASYKMGRLLYSLSPTLPYFFSFDRFKPNLKIKSHAKYKLELYGFFALSGAAGGI